MSQALCQKDKLKGPINGTTQPNGQMPQAAHSVSAVLQEAQTHTETSKDRKPALGNHQEPGAPPAPHGPKSTLPPTLLQRSWDTICSPVTPRKAKSTDGGGFPAPPDDFLPTATAASTERHRAAATPAGGSRAPATARGLHGAARPRTSCPLPQRSSRGLLCPTLPTGAELQCSEPTHE
ncbi:amyloid beta A4 precursor protein-binding family B member 1-interacting protein-like isoform X3 [Rhinopithecus roxellana]|uniref:amyloid beta A4 precursor protein-binding family B member 1-interacting protein-like isoform X3 n=1 Tax=Rhinopithecus roxellana TaxID=61622 RepID=UPI000532FF88|nr:amyloid beta A4 precursor protein-binding family B member 1-interacting protein-like isoform X3 [Rhinopithecus roxellana]XP_030795921.1 amyloid beta A4 precursor protein-binding family B member 1-interacting protein-like isoform X3 [Rhinopithecus roxellana]